MTLDRNLVLEIGPAVVVEAWRGGGDVDNAWDVLLDALNGDKRRAYDMVMDSAKTKGLTPEDRVTIVLDRVAANLKRSRV